MLRRALCRVAVDTVGARGASYPVHVCGDGCVVATAKTREVDSVFAWEVLFAYCVCEGGMVSEERVRWKSVECSLCNGGVYVGVKGGVVW